MAASLALFFSSHQRAHPSHRGGRDRLHLHSQVAPPGEDRSGRHRWICHRVLQSGKWVLGSCVRGCGHLLGGRGGSPSSVLFFLSAPADQWVAANKELVDRNQFKVKDLPVGEKMLFRVVAVNIAGRSPPASLTHPVTIREIVGQLALTTSCLVFSSLTKNQNVLFCPPKPARTPEDPPPSTPEKQPGHVCGRQGEPGDPLPGQSHRFWF